MCRLRVNPERRHVVFPAAAIAAVPPFPSPSFSGATPPLCRAASTFFTSLFLFKLPTTPLVPLNPPTSPVLEEDFADLPNNFFEPPLNFCDAFDGSISPTGLDSEHDLDFFNSPVKPMAPGSAYLMTSSLWDALDPSQPGAISVEDEDMDLESSHSDDNTAQSNAEEDEEEVDELESSQQCSSLPPSPYPRTPIVPTPALVDSTYGSDCESPTDASPISPLVFGTQAEQVGGGMREATPPLHLTPTQLRSKITLTAIGDSEAQEAIVRRQKNSAPPIPFATFAAAVGWKGLVEISKAPSLFGEGGSSSAFGDKVLDGGGGSSSALGSRFTGTFGAGEQRNLTLEEVPSKPTWGPLGVDRKLKCSKKKKPTPTPPALSMGPLPPFNVFQTGLPTSLTTIDNNEAASTNVLDFGFCHEDTTELDSRLPPLPPLLPSPPAPPSHSSPPSRASSPLSPLPNDNTNFDYASDNTDDIALDAIDVGGRPCSAVEAELTCAFEEIETILERTAAATGLTGKCVRRRLQKHMGGADSRLGMQSWWNDYQAYVNRPHNRVTERQRLDPSYICPPDKEPAVLSGPEAKLAWDAFNVKYPPVVAQEILMQDNILLGMETSQTHVGCKALFGRVAKKLHFELQTEYHVNKYQGLLLLVGSHVNEDGALGQVLGTGGLGSDEFFDSIKMSRDDLLGFTKVAAYQENAATFASDDIKDVPKPVGTEKPRRKGVQEIRMLLSRASKEDIGKDAFTELVPKNHFAWGSLREVLTGNSYRIIGWPADVCLPFQFPSAKALSGLWEWERTSLVAAVEARGVEGQGFRLAPWTYNPGNYIIYTHDYKQDTPDGAASDPRVRKHWRSSSAVALPYDLDGASVPQKRYHVEPFLQKAPKLSSAKSKAVSSSSEVESEEEEEEEEMLAPALRTMKGPSAAPAQAKRRPKAASEAQKRPPSEAPATRARAREMQEGEGVPAARSGPSTNLKSALRRPNTGQRKRKGVIGMDSDVEEGVGPVGVPKKRVRITVNDLEDDAPPANKEPTTSRPKPTKTYGKPPAQEHAAIPPPRRLMSHVAVPQAVGGPSQVQMNSQPTASSSSLAVSPPAPPAPAAPQNPADLMALLGLTAEGLLQLAAIMKGP
ncbi:hypothetical protein DFH09DRAFT_1280951 [Mycena vulgaris]|nr:hypothetical protein DFH09DRAFT_1280951 [Mycena vulgaris]